MKVRSWTVGAWDVVDDDNSENDILRTMKMALFMRVTMMMIMMVTMRMIYSNSTFKTC